MKKRMTALLLVVCLIAAVLPTTVSAASTNQETIWNYLRAQGFSAAGVAGIMGNLEAESGYLPNNMEDTANQKSGFSDAQFTEGVDSGEITREEFISSDRFGVCTCNPTGSPTGQEYGYGLAQWTFTTRKAALYDFAKSRGVSIADLTMQLDFMIGEMSSSLKSYLKSATDVEDACVTFHNDYERSSATASMLTGRVNRAISVYNKYSGSTYVKPGTVHFPKVAVYTQGQFTDVSASEWYTGSVASAVEFGLMKGNGPSTFNPTGNVTIAEAVTMAARIHSIYTTGGESFVQKSGQAWYQVYLDYAYQNGIISQSDYTCDVNQKITRAKFAAIFAKALPEKALVTKNTVADGKIPDVPMSATYAAAVYQLYRAGILSGSDEAGSFYPQNTIRRAEAAAVVSRMADSDNRVAVSLP